MKKAIGETEERIFTLEDVKALFRRKKALLLQTAVFIWVALFGLALIRAPKYRIQATFKEGVEKSGNENVIKNLLSSVSAGDQSPQAATLMRSNRVLKPLIQRLGVQAVIQKGDGIFSKLYRRIQDNIRAERSRSLGDYEGFRFRDVFYEGEEGVSYTIRFDDPLHFHILGNGKKPLAYGIVGGEVQLPSAQFVLEKTPKNLRCHQNYNLSIQPWEPHAEQIRSQLKIASDKMNKSIYELSFFHRDRHFGVKLLNELMSEYQRYLKKEHDQISKEQLSYLDQRQDEICAKMSTLFKEYESHIAKNLSEKGVVGAQDEVQSLTVPYQKMLSQLFHIELELGRLKAFVVEKNWGGRVDEGPFSDRLSEIAQALQDLRQQKDLLEISLQKKDGLSGANLLKKGELFDVRTRQEASKNLLQAVLENKESSFDISFDPEKSLTAWAKHLETGEERKDFIGYLENHIRLLSIQEKILQERFFYGESPTFEFEGIDLPTARDLFVEYNNKLDQSEAAMRYFAKFQEEIQQEEFDIGSLSSLLKDEISQKLITEAGELSFRLHDAKHHSEKERERWSEEVVLQKNILKRHLEQLYKVEELNFFLNKEKIRALQHVTLDCINRQISVLHEQAEDAVKERKEALLSDKALIEEKMGVIREQLSDLPEKWRLEKWLSLKTELSAKMMETLAGLVESKTIGHHLHHVESKPLDYATLPRKALPPYLFRVSTLGAISAAFLLFFFFLIQAILKGFPSSFAKLKAMQFPLLGEISGVVDGAEIEELTGTDLEIIRKMALFLEEKPGGKVISLIGGQGPDYSYALAKNFAKRSLRTLLIRCDFQEKYQKKDVPGLLQIWNQETSELPIRSRNGYDLLPSGGFTPYGPELMHSESFKKLIDLFKEKYDAIFLFLRSPLEHTESMPSLRLADKALVTVHGESTEILTPFADWAYDGESCRLMFVTVRNP